MNADPRKNEKCIISRRNAYFLLYSMANGDYDSKETVIRMAEEISEGLGIDPDAFQKFCIPTALKQK